MQSSENFDQASGAGMIKNSGFNNDIHPVNDLTKDPLATLKVFPNPFMNTLSVVVPDPTIQFSVTIIDMQGKIVYERKNIYQSDLDLSDLKEGMYVLRFSSEIINESKKIIKVE